MAPASAYFFLWRFLRNRFLRLCVAIFLRLRLRPFGMATILSQLRRDSGGNPRLQLGFHRTQLPAREPEVPASFK